MTGIFVPENMPPLQMIRLGESKTRKLLIGFADIKNPSLATEVSYYHVKIYQVFVWMCAN